jgi:glycosyltransferase involved in cell wall biosynthesis
MSAVSRVARGVTTAGSLAAIALTAHTAYNLTRLRTPPEEPAEITEKVSILVPARNEAHRITRCIESLLAQRRLADVEIIVLDDQSQDGTGALVTALIGDDQRARVIDGIAVPDGWLGKPWACAQLARAATGSVLVFVDADVEVAPDGIAASVALMRSEHLSCVCPYPRQVTETPAERLVQPLLQWSWLTTLPLALAERSARPSLTAANGQLLAIDASAYRALGGHAPIRDEVLDDIALMRSIKMAGHRGGVVDGTAVANCRMYDGWTDLRDGYTKSLWSAFGPPSSAAGVIGVLAAAYIAPAIGAVAGQRLAFVGLTAGVAGRVMVARRTGGRVWPDALAHPASVAVLGYLTARSHVERGRGRLTWKGRSVSG